MGENQDALHRLKFGFCRATFSHSSFETCAGGQPGLPDKPVSFPVCCVGKEAAAGAGNPAAGGGACRNPRRAIHLLFVRAPTLTTEPDTDRPEMKTWSLGGGEEDPSLLGRKSSACRPLQPPPAHQHLSCNGHGAGGGGELLLITGNYLFYILLLMFFCCK